MYKDEVSAYCDANVQAEWERMERHPVEFTINKHYIDEYVRPGMRVLDIGGGPGRYSMHLAQRGCEVTLLDLSAGNVEFARAKAESMGLNIRAVQGDACALGELAQGEFDAVLLMGPLYHLLNWEERAQAVAQAYAALRDGGYVFAACINSYAGIMYYLQNDPSIIFAESELEYVAAVERGESYSGAGFTQMHMMGCDEFTTLMGSAGFKQLHIANSEGMCSPREPEIAMSPEVLKRWIEFSLKVCERPELMGMAEHLLYVGKK